MNPYIQCTDYKCIQVLNVEATKMDEVYVSLFKNQKLSILQWYDYLCQLMLHDFCAKLSISSCTEEKKIETCRNNPMSTMDQCFSQNNNYFSDIIGLEKIFGGTNTQWSKDIKVCDIFLKTTHMV